MAKLTVEQKDFLLGLLEEAARVPNNSIAALLKGSLAYTELKKKILAAFPEEDWSVLEALEESAEEAVHKIPTPRPDPFGTPKYENWNRLMEEKRAQLMKEMQTQQEEQFKRLTTESKKDLLERFRPTYDYRKQELIITPATDKPWGEG